MHSNVKFFRWRKVDCPRDCEAARSSFALQCVKEMDNDGGMVKDNIYCSNEPKPSDLQCMSPCVTYSEWSEVSSLMSSLFYTFNCVCFQCCEGQTHQHRSAHCLSSPTSEITLNEKYCQPVDRESLQRPCNVNECPAYWNIDRDATVSLTQTPTQD